MAYSELAGMMSKALEQLQQMFKSKVGCMAPLPAGQPAPLLSLHQHAMVPALSIPAMPLSMSIRPVCD
jgi:hypothetical protein